MADVARLQLEVDSRQADKAAASLDELTKSGARAENQTKDLSAASKQLKPNISAVGTSSKRAAPDIRNLSLQLNQVAQQGAVTGNFLQALSIQLPDILLSFGTLGVLVGAAAGAFAGPLLSALQGTNEELKKLDDNINDLNDDFSTLTETQRAYLVSASQVRQSGINDSIQDLSTSIQDAEENLKNLESGFRRTARGQRIAVATDPDAIRQAREELLQLSAARDTANQKLEREAELQKDIIAGRSEAAEKERDNLAIRIQALEGGFDPAVAAQQAFERRNAVIQQANSEGLIQQEQFNQLRIQNAERLQEDLTRIEQQGTDQRTKILTDGQQAGLAITSSLLGQAASIAREGGKEQFDQYKALASAQAAVSASLAIANALAAVPPPFNVALAGTIGALAAVQIAQIQQQEYQPRVLGGQMKAGGSFLVGERGPELITMGNRNANITPNNQLSGEPAGPQVTQVFNISAGVQGTVQAEIARSIPLIKQVAISSINENIKAGGSVARQVGRRR